jgi:protein O-mannosyl-transferase
MAKPMLVTLPFVLLLLDYWPLERMNFTSRRTPALPEAAPPIEAHDGETRAPSATRSQTPACEADEGGRRSAFRGFSWLVAEKLPLLIVAGAACLVTMLVQKTTLSLNDRLPVGWRIGNAMISYLTYLENFFYPVGLIVVYPRLGPDLPIWRLVAAVLVLVTITASVILARRRCPYLLVGWLWYLGMSVPVIGFLQVGLTAVADRFTYLPQIGLGIALTWGVADLCRKWPFGRWACGVVSTVVLAALMAQAAYQTSFWRDSETLWNYTLECMPDNGPANNNLGDLLAAEGRLDEAMVYFEKALKLLPNSEYPHYNRGHLLEILGKWDEAKNEYYSALELNPCYTLPYNRLGLLLISRGRFEEAIAFLKNSLELDGANPETHYDLAKAFAAIGHRKEAEELVHVAILTAPNYAVNNNMLGLVVADRGRIYEAIEHFQRAIDAQPNYVEARNNLARILMKNARLSEAALQYKAVLKIDPQNAEARDGMAQLRAIRGHSPPLDVSPLSAKMGNMIKKSP